MHHSSVSVGVYVNRVAKRLGTRGNRAHQLSCIHLYEALFCLHKMARSLPVLYVVGKWFMQVYLPHVRKATCTIRNLDISFWAGTANRQAATNNYSFLAR